jgi:uncharacterized protein YjbJ (UPF0337 family)
VKVAADWPDKLTVKEIYMKQSTKDKIEGTAHQVKGAVKEKVGNMTNNPKLVGEGVDEKNGGKIQKKIGEVEKVFEKKRESQNAV